jgi:hypothetical protein
VYHQFLELKAEIFALKNVPIKFKNSVGLKVVFGYF